MGVFAPDMRAPLTEANVNLYCGSVMLAFGAFLLLLAWRARATRRMTEASANFRLGRWHARFPRARPRQPDRRAHRLQPRLRAAGGARPGHLRRRRARPPTASCASIPSSSGETARVACRRRSAGLQRAGHWSDYPIGVAQQLIARGLRHPAGEPADPQHGAGRLGAEFLGRARSLVRAGAAAAAAPSTRWNWPGSASAPSGISSACRAASWISTFPSSGASTPPSRSIAAAWSTARAICPTAIAFLAVNTMVKHELAGSAYRRARGGMRRSGELASAAVSRGGEPARRHARAVRSGEGDCCRRWSRAGRATW